jgi:hypothetical protein
MWSALSAGFSGIAFLLCQVEGMDCNSLAAVEESLGGETATKMLAPEK